MGRYISAVVGQFFSSMVYKSSRENLKTLHKMNSRLNKGTMIDSENIGNDFNNVFGDLDRSIKNLTKEAV